MRKHNYVIDPDIIIEKYRKESERFDPELFKNAYFHALRLIEKHGFDGAAQRIPFVLRKFVNRPAKTFKLC